MKVLEYVSKCDSVESFVAKVPSVIQNEDFTEWCPDSLKRLLELTEKVLECSSIGGGLAVARLMCCSAPYIKENREVLVLIFLELHKLCSVTALRSDFQESDQISLWENVNNYYHVLTQTCSTELDNRFERIALDLLETVVDERLPNYLKQIRIKILNMLLGDTAAPRKFAFRKSYNEVFLKLPLSLSTAGDYDFQTCIVETLFRLSSSDQRSQEDCRKFLNAFNDSKGSARLVHSLPCRSVRIGDFHLGKPKTQSYEQFWVDFNLQSKSLSLLFEKEQNGNAQDSTKGLWESLTVYVNEVQYVRIVMTGKLQVLTLLLNKPPIELFVSQSTFSSEDVKLFSKELVIEFESRSEIQKTCQLLFGNDVEVSEDLKKRIKSSVVSKSISLEDLGSAAIKQQTPKKSRDEGSSKTKVSVVAKPFICEYSEEQMELDSQDVIPSSLPAYSGSSVLKSKGRHSSNSTSPLTPRRTLHTSETSCSSSIFPAERCRNKLKNIIESSEKLLKNKKKGETKRKKVKCTHARSTTVISENKKCTTPEIVENSLENILIPASNSQQQCAAEDHKPFQSESASDVTAASLDNRCRQTKCDVQSTQQINDKTAGLCMSHMSNGEKEDVLNKTASESSSVKIMDEFENKTGEVKVPVTPYKTTEKERRDNTPSPCAEMSVTLPFVTDKQTVSDKPQIKDQIIILDNNVQISYHTTSENIEGNSTSVAKHTSDLSDKPLTLKETLQLSTKDLVNATLQFLVDYPVSKDTSGCISENSSSKKASKKLPDAKSAFIPKQSSIFNKSDTEKGMKKLFHNSKTFMFQDTPPQNLEATCHEANFVTGVEKLSTALTCNESANFSQDSSSFKYFKIKNSGNNTENYLDKTNSTRCANKQAVNSCTNKGNQKCRTINNKINKMLTPKRANGKGIYSDFSSTEHGTDHSWLHRNEKKKKVLDVSRTYLSAKKNNPSKKRKSSLLMKEKTTKLNYSDINNGSPDSVKFFKDLPKSGKPNGTIGTHSVTARLKSEMLKSHDQFSSAEIVERWSKSLSQSSETLRDNDDSDKSPSVDEINFGFSASVNKLKKQKYEDSLYRTERKTFVTTIAEAVQNILGSKESKSNRIDSTDPYFPPNPPNNTPNPLLFDSKALSSCTFSGPLHSTMLDEDDKCKHRFTYTSVDNMQSYYLDDVAESNDTSKSPEFKKGITYDMNESEYDCSEYQRHVSIPKKAHSYSSSSEVSVHSEGPKRSAVMKPKNEEGTNFEIKEIAFRKPLLTPLSHHTKNATPNSKKRKLSASALSCPSAKKRNVSISELSGPSLADDSRKYDTSQAVPSSALQSAIRHVQGLILQVQSVVEGLKLVTNTLEDFIKDS